MLIFVLPTKMRLVVSFWTFFSNISRQPRRIRKKRDRKNFCWCRGSKV